MKYFDVEIWNWQAMACQNKKPRREGGASKQVSDLVAVIESAAMATIFRTIVSTVATGAFFTRPGSVYRQSSSTNLFAIELRNGFGGVGLVAHGHEGKAL